MNLASKQSSKFVQFLIIAASIAAAGLLALFWAVGGSSPGRVEFLSIAPGRGAIAIEYEGKLLNGLVLSTVHTVDGQPVIPGGANGGGDTLLGYYDVGGTLLCPLPSNLDFAASAAMQGIRVHAGQEFKLKLGDEIVVYDFIDERGQRNRCTMSVRQGK